MQHAASSKCSYQTIARMAGAALKLYVHKLIYRISYFLFGVALGQGECGGQSGGAAAACILSSCRLSAQPDYAAYKVNSDHRRRGGRQEEQQFRVTLLLVAYRNRGSSSTEANSNQKSRQMDKQLAAEF